MPDTPSETPLQPELRVAVTIPLSPDPFEQARQLAEIEPHISAVERALPSGAAIDRRIVHPIRRKAKAAEGGAE